jgi:hemolysin D
MKSPALVNDVTELDQQAWDFRPDLLTIQRSPPTAWPRGVLLLMVALIGMLLLWATLAKLDVIASAQGRLVPMTFTKIVQPAESGVVVEVLVKDGDTVRAGQVLLRLDARVATAEFDGLSRDVAIKRLTLNRIEAELADRSFLAPVNAPAEIALQVEAQFRARRQSYLDAVAQEDAALSKSRADLMSAEQIMSKLKQTLPIFRQSAQAHEKLLEDGFIGEVAANEKKRELLESEQNLRAQEATVQSLRAVIVGIERKQSSLRSSYHSQLENERLDTVTLLNRSSQELDKSVIKNGLLEIRSPTEGVVNDLTVSATGAVVGAGNVLMNIVPKEEPVQAEVLLSNEDIGFVIVGQKAHIKIAAYPFQKYGLLEGQVSLISADSADQRQQQQTGQPKLSYRALISIDRQLLKSPRGGTLELQPGMLVTAEIHQGKRTVLEYLLSPIQKVALEAGRER